MLQIAPRQRQALHLLRREWRIPGMSANRYDVIIIGSGAGGGTLAYRLAPTGKKILILERGDYVPRERENWDSRSVVVEGRYNIREAWRGRGRAEVPTRPPSPAGRN